MPINLDNANFKSFVQFAQQRFDAGDTKAVVNASATDPLEGREILKLAQSKTDSVHKWTRGADEGTANNRTRALFRAAIAQMFDGEEHIPASVKKAMLLADYDKGKPLTARRILAVKAAIDIYRNVHEPDPDMQPLAIDEAKATEMAEASRTLLGVSLGDDDLAQAVGLLQKYGSGLPAKTARVLSNFLVNTAAVGDFSDETEEMVKNLVKDMKGWKEFDFNDARLAKLGKKFVQRLNAHVRKTLADPSRFSPSNPGVAQQLVADADRGEWEIDGQKFPIGSDPNAIVDKFCSVIKAPKARKVVSAILNQAALADLETLFTRSGALVGDAGAKNVKEEFLYRIPGGNLFVHRDIARDDYGIVADKDAHYGLEVSDDGRTATVVVAIDKHLSTSGTANADYRIGTATIAERITVDLTKATPAVIGVTFSQTFTPDAVDKPAR